MPVSAEDLHIACDKLVQGARVKVDVKGQPQWATLPSLLEQLATAEIASNDQAGETTTHEKPKSKPTINTGVVGLLHDMPRVCARQCRDMGAGVTTSATTGTAQLLRTATNATTRTDDPDEMEAWLWQLHRWRATARAELGIDATRTSYLRGIHCPRCQQNHALRITWTEPDDTPHIDETWTWDAIRCAQCGHQWRRPQMGDLLIELLAIGEHVIMPHKT